MAAELLNPFDSLTIPFAQWAQASVDWLTASFRPAFQAARWPVAQILDGLTALLSGTPQTVFLAVLFLGAWQIVGLRSAVTCVLCMVTIGLIGVWPDTMITLALILTACAFSILIGLPLGILAGRSDRAEAILRPILDVMQTLPAFVYLVPIVMLVGIGNVPGVIVTTVFAIPPIVRLTSLGLRGVPPAIVEAAHAFGSTGSQVLWKVQMPLAVRSIRMGINQTLLMSLAMVTYASMIAVQGLGLLVLRGIGRLDMGLAAQGGVGIVLLAIMLARLSDALSLTDREGRGSRGRRPVAIVLKTMTRAQRAA